MATIEEKERDQIEDEWAILSAKRERILKKTGKSVEDISQIDLTQYINTHFFDEGIFDKISDNMIITFFYPNDKFSRKAIRENSINMRKFRDIKQIGTESVEGYALMASFGISKNIFVIKGPKNPEHDNLLHEFFVASEGTNNLRYEVPNFAYVFSALNCTPKPDDIKSEKVLGWCDVNANGKNIIHYAAYERIPGKDLATLNKDCTTAQFLSYFIQILYGLQYAANQVRFTHYDLHSENVLCREIKEGYIPYPNRNGSYVYVLTDYVPTIIDYGRSHIKVGNKHYGAFGFEQYGVYHNKCRPFYDIYKVLGFSLNDMRIAKNPSFDECVSLLKFFNGDHVTKSQLIEQVIQDAENFHELSTSIMKNENSLDVQDYIDWILETYDMKDIVVNEVPENEKVYNCEEDFCPRPDLTLQKLKGKSKTSISRSRTRLNPLSFQKQYEGLDRRTKKYKDDKLRFESDLEKLKTCGEGYCQEIVSQIESDLKNVHKQLSSSLNKVIDVSDKPGSSYDDLVSYRNKYDQYYDIIDLVKEYADLKALQEFYEKKFNTTSINYDLNKSDLSRFQKNLGKLSNLMQSTTISEEYKTYKNVLI